jgi:carbonic anhydrase/acetyltransferase-like protein (isoleucine patch superfamily)
MSTDVASPFARLQPPWPPLSPRSPPVVQYPSTPWDWDALRTTPLIDETAFIAPGAVIYGRVRLQARSSVWFGCVLRGDHEWIDVGEETNIQDGSVLHVDSGYPCLIGNRVTLGHRVVLHASVVEDDALIGIGAVVLSRCVIGRGALVAAGSVIREGTHVPPHTLWAGCPARQLKGLSESQQARLALTFQHYVNNAAGHRAAFGGPTKSGG